MSIDTISFAGLLASAFISSTIAPGGSEAVLAYMVSQENSPVFQLIIIATIGNTLGALTTWGLGLWAAKKYPIDGLLPGNKQKSIQTIRKYGNWALLFSWLPIVGDGLCFAGGWLKQPIASAIFAIFIGKGLRYLAVAYAFI